jgi:hypothetical protein
MGIFKLAKAKPETVIQEDEWPERNRVQAEFLTDSLCFAVAKAAGLIDESINKKGDMLKVTEHATRPSFAADGELVHIDVDAIRGRPITDDTKLYREVESHVGFIACCRLFEHNNRDVVYSIYRRTQTEKRLTSKNGDDIRNCINEEEHCTLGVDIKPVLGDDYPMVIRAMREANMTNWMQHNVLYVEKIDTKHVTAEQLLAMFKESGITIVTKAMLS